MVYNATMPSFLGGVSRKFKPYGMEWNDEAIRTLAELVATRQLHLPIDGEYGWEKEDVIKAFDRQMSARVCSECDHRVSRQSDSWYRAGSREDHRSNVAETKRCFAACQCA